MSKLIKCKACKKQRTSWWRPSGGSLLLILLIIFWYGSKPSYNTYPTSTVSSTNKTAVQIKNDKKLSFFIKNRTFILKTINTFILNEEYKKALVEINAYLRVTSDKDLLSLNKIATEGQKKVDLVNKCISVIKDGDELKETGLKSFKEDNFIDSDNKFKRALNLYKENISDCKSNSEEIGQRIDYLMKIIKNKAFIKKVALHQARILKNTDLCLDSLESGSIAYWSGDKTKATSIFKKSKKVCQYTLFEKRQLYLESGERDPVKPKAYISKPKVQNTGSLSECKETFSLAERYRENGARDYNNGNISGAIEKFNSSRIAYAMAIVNCKGLYLEGQARANGEMVDALYKGLSK